MIDPTYAETISGTFAFGNDPASPPSRVSLIVEIWASDRSPTTYWCEGTWRFGETRVSLPGVMFRAKTIDEGRAMMFTQWELGMLGAREVEDQ